MITVPSDYRSVPEFLAPFMEEFKQDHGVKLGINPTTQDSIKSMFQQDNLFHSMIQKMARWGLAGALTGGIYYTMMNGNDNQFINTRRALGKYGMGSKIKGFGAWGAVFGFTWFMLNDFFFNKKHEVNTLNSYNLAHALQGGIMVGCMYHPSAIGYGMAIGFAFAALKERFTVPALPIDFTLNMPNFDLEKRRNMLRDDQEKQLSMRTSLVQSRNYHPI